MPLLSGRVGWVLVVALVVVSTLLRAWVARGIEAPWIFPDEVTYALLGRSFWDQGSLSMLGGVTGGYSLLYPAVVGIPLSLWGPSTGMAVIQVVQAAVMSSVALVVFAWGRQVIAEGWALGAAGLALCIPGIAYSGMLMTETLFYPLVAVALWALWRVLVQPSFARQAVFLSASTLAVLTRIQALALLPAALLAVGLYCAFRRDLSVMRRSAPLLSLIVCGGIVALALSRLWGGWADSVGVYAAAMGGYEVGSAARDVFWHTGAVFVIVAGVPLIALGVLLAECARGGESDTAAALVATACAWTMVSVVEVGTFASRWVDHIAERDLITVAPPLFLVLALWLARGIPRPQLLTAVIAIAVAAPAILLPVSRFATQESALDAFSFIPLWRLREATSSASLEVVYALAVGLVVVAAVLVPCRARFILVGLVAWTLVLVTTVSTHEIQRLARADRTWVFSTAQPRWIDENANGPVTYIYAETAVPQLLWKTAYWNERIDRVLEFDGVPPAAPLPTRRVAPRVNGLIRDTAGRRLRGGFVVAPSNIALAGTELASYGPAADIPGMTLWRADAPLRVRWITTGLRANGDIAGAARVQVPGCRRGHLSLTLLGKAGTPVTISVDGQDTLTVTPAPDTTWAGEIPAPASADGTSACEYQINSPGLVGTTRVEFVYG